MCPTPRKRLDVMHLQEPPLAAAPALRVDEGAAPFIPPVHLRPDGLRNVPRAPRATFRPCLSRLPPGTAPAPNRSFSSFSRRRSNAASNTGSRSRPPRLFTGCRWLISAWTSSNFATNSAFAVNVTLCRTSDSGSTRSRRAGAGGVGTGPGDSSTDRIAGAASGVRGFGRGRGSRRTDDGTSGRGATRAAMTSISRLLFPHTSSSSAAWFSSVRCDAITTAPLRCNTPRAIRSMIPGNRTAARATRMRAVSGDRQRRLVRQPQPRRAPPVQARAAVVGIDAPLVHLRQVHEQRRGQLEAPRVERASLSKQRLVRKSADSIAVQ